MILLMLHHYLLAIAFVLQSSNARADVKQHELWQHVRGYTATKHIQQIKISEREREIIIKLLKSREGVDGWGCNTVDPVGNWLKDLRFERLPLSEAHAVILVEAGVGCARGGQGANGAMWVVQFDDAGNPVLLASPEKEFNGWIFSVLSTASNGYKDIVLGWHMGGPETPLKYFRFDGKLYEQIGSAVMRPGERGQMVIVSGK